MAGGGSPVKKVLILILCVGLFCLAALPVTATDNIVQIYELCALGDNTLAFSAKNTATFWEKPTLKAGEYTTTTGLLIIRNSTASEQKIGLRTIELPYDNEDALRYLNHVYITVQNGNTVLYEGAYSRINDDQSFSLNTVLSAGAQVTYSIDMRCDYTYIGEQLSAEDLIKWEFYVTVEDTPETSSSPFSDPALFEVIFACGLAVLLLGGIFLYDRFIKIR